MSENGPFRPEWIKQLLYVENNSPHNKNIKWNKGHLLHQLTYFVGKVNFYYYDKNKKKVAIMNTGDSMFISPYVPHTFASRDPCVCTAWSAVFFRSPLRLEERLVDTERYGDWIVYIE